MELSIPFMSASNGSRYVQVLASHDVASVNEISAHIDGEKLILKRLSIAENDMIQTKHKISLHMGHMRSSL